MVIQMRSRKILVTIVVGLLLVGVVGPVIARSDRCNPLSIEDCTLQDWLEWLIEMFQWLMGVPDGPPPVPGCLLE